MVANFVPYFSLPFSETFRKHPAGAWLERVCNKPLEIREKSETSEALTLVPGDCVVIPMDAIQKDPQYFPDPEIFNPDRFLDKSSEINKDVIMPFGIGPRQCIASRFALMQTKVFFYTLLAKFTLKTNDETVQELKLVKGTLLRKIEGGVCLDLVKRDKVVN